MNVLAFETATQTCGVALLQGDEILAEGHLHKPRVHSERCTPLAEEVMGHAGLRASDLDAVAVSMGPGSYTGLRIGVSTAKGWALAAGADLIGVPTFEAYAAQVGPFADSGDVIAVLFDARRDEVYAGAFRLGDDDMATFAETTALTVTDLPDWLGSVPKSLWLLGDGVQKSREAVDAMSTDARVLPVSTCPPSAAWVARRGARRLGAERIDDIDTFEPLYVKEVHATPSPSPFA